MEVQKIHPYDLGALLANNENDATVEILKNGLVVFDGSVYEQSAEVAHSPENEPKKFWAKRLERHSLGGEA